ncbi:P-loop-containing nucleoside triphosphate hydrolase [Chloropicon primus]|nr:P-loop-containing nucleoside triphosphate hydrolase [Chloropicon primus]
MFRYDAPHGVTMPNNGGQYVFKSIQTRPAFEKRVQQCMDAIQKSEKYQCSPSVTIALLALLVTKVEHNAREFSFCYDQSVLVSAKAITKVTQTVATGQQSEGNERLTTRALKWLVYQYKSGTLFPKIIGGLGIGQPVVKDHNPPNHQHHQKPEIVTKAQGHLPQATGAQLIVDLLTMLQQVGGRFDSTSPDHLGEASEDRAGHPSVCTPASGYPLELYQLRERGELKQVVGEAFRRRPKKHKEGVVVRDSVRFFDLGKESSQKRKYRAMTYKNRGRRPVFLIRAGFRNALNASNFELTDDFGITDDFEDREEVLMLRPGHEYQITVIMTGRSDSEIQEEPVVSVVFWNEECGFNACHATILVIPFSTEEEKAGGGRSLSSEAEVYISKSLSSLFDEMASHVKGVESLPLISGLIKVGILPQPSHNLISTPFKSFSDTNASHAFNRMHGLRLPPWNGEMQDNKEYRKFQRGILCQEVDEMRGMRNLQMFHIPFHRGVVEFRTRRYQYVRQNKGESNHGPYSGPMLNKLCNLKNKLPCVLFDVPGLLEKDPELKAGALVHVRGAEETEKEFILIVIATHNSTAILLAPDAVFEMLDTNWHVTFQIDFDKYRNMYSTLGLAYGLRVFDFDKEFQCALGGSKLTKQELKKVKVPVLNDSQLQVVGKVCKALRTTTERAQTQPTYITCRGPAGTGKSLTAVMTAALVAKEASPRRILICTPGEFTCDLLAEALAKELEKHKTKKQQNAKSGLLKRGSVIRLNDPKRPLAFASKGVLPLCKLDENVGCFTIPPPEELAKYQVVCTSCSSCWFLHRGQTNLAAAQNFDLCVVDEAGQATLADLMGPLSCMGPAQGGGKTEKCVLLLGDEHQLGPSSAAVNDTVGSVFEYFRTDVRLSMNYRSNQELLEIPKALFYGEDLEAVAPPTEVNAPDVRQTDIFSNVENSSASILTVCCQAGKHQRSSIYSKGRSCFNAVEANTVKDICLQFIGKQIASAASISVISLSRAQNGLIRKELRHVGLSEIRCGTVDDFQGQQGDVVIISTVASSIKALDCDEKRFNVATTRARRLVIVVGSSKVLKDKRAGPWNELTQMCMKKNVVLNFKGQSDQGSAVEEREETLTKVATLAKTALLGVGHEETMFPDNLYDTNISLGWAATDDEFNLPARIVL